MAALESKIYLINEALKSMACMLYTHFNMITRPHNNIIL